MADKSLSVKEVVARYLKGELDIVAWNKTFIDTIKAKDKDIRAIVNFSEETWLENLNAALENRTENFEKLTGVPVGAKDIFNTIGFPTEMGSPIWKDFNSGNDARVIYDIKFNGGFIACKTVTAEFAVHTPNETHNPWDLNYSPGTSSSGSAAAVAAGMLPLALGTQTAGSIVRPASYCGVFGFKPTFGTLPRTGMLKTTDTLDTIGFFATNIDDCELLFDVMRVKGLDYPVVNKKLENPDFQKKVGQKWKVGILVDQLDVCKNYSDYTVKAFDLLVEKLKGNGDLELIFPQFSSNFNEAHKVQETIYHKALSYYFKKEFEKKTQMSEVLYQIIEEGNQISGKEYADAIQKQSELAKEMDTMFDDFDVILTLSTAGVAPEFGIAIDPPDTCLIWTMCGLPVINVPLFQHGQLPFGVQVISKKYCDYKLISFIKELTEKGIFPEFSTVKSTL